jgi:hypothetical protein
LKFLPRIGDAVKVTKQMEFSGSPKKRPPPCAGWGRRMCIRTYLMCAVQERVGTRPCNSLAPEPVPGAVPYFGLTSPRQATHAFTQPRIMRKPMHAPGCKLSRNGGAPPLP